MARENSFTFIGQVINAPIVLLNEESNNYRIAFTMLTVRRNGRKDYPRINVYDLTEEEARNYVQTMRPGVFAIIRGMIATTVVKKPVRCESCGELSKIDTLQTEIISFGKPYVMNEKPVPVDIIEFSNRGIVLGSLCSKVYRRDGKGGGAAAQFQMAISRKYHTKDMNEEERTDFPWVKVFGDTASECMKRLRTGSQIYASCAFQTRDVERHVKCQNCEQVLVYEERVGEIVPNSVEFLNNCLFEDTVKKPNQTKKNNKWKKNKWKKKHRKGAGNEKKI